MASQIAGWSSAQEETYGALLRHSTRRLTAGGITNAARDAEVLLAYGLGMTREQLVLRSDESINLTQTAACEELVRRRLGREPVAYIIGIREFWSREFLVTPDVLIPRPETELLVEFALQWADQQSRQGAAPLCIADIGTGSGAIAVALGGELPTACLVATDISEKALALARINAERNGVGERIRLVRSDLFGQLREGWKFDLVVSNPPYIADGEIAELEPEVGRWEPQTALRGGADGLEFYRRFAAETPAHLSSRGTLLMEIGAGMGAAVSALFRQAGWSEVLIHRDYAGCERIAIAHSPAGIA